MEGANGEAPRGAPAASLANGKSSLSQKLGNSLSFLKRKNSSDSSRADKLRQEIDFTEHTWPQDKLYEYYGATPEGGLSSAQVLQNRGKYGYNQLTPPPTTPW